MAQDKLDLDIQKKLDTVEEYKFEPIKGYPMLHWKGKRPFTSTQYYPAQQKEIYGEEVNGWMNKIFWGDNLQVMSHLLKEYRGKINLVYIDPPFDSKVSYGKEIKLKGKKAKNSQNSFEEKQYTDIWNNDEYLQFMYERLVLIKELMHSNGSIFLHCDWHKVHHLRMILDEVFGPDNFINEIIWCYHGPGSPGMRQYNRKHDNILWYCKSKPWTFNDNEVRVPHNEKTLDNFKKGLEGSGFIADNYDIPDGKIPEDYWTFAIAGRFPKDGIKRVGYPTEKPVGLIERIIKTASKPNDIIFDCFMGSGVTQSVSLSLGRKFLGADINLGAIETTIKRLNLVSKNIIENQVEVDFKNSDGEVEKVKDFYTGFSVHNVNNYDVFRNPVQAKEILKQALEIQPLPSNTIYDGEKDGRMVKIMPVNRIATRADLNELISGFNYKSFQKKFEKQPNKPVENLLLVCMGHEPDLAATLQKEIHPYKIDVEVVDILRDKSNLEFKRDSEAEIIIEDNKLVIKQFYPMNLLQKLSIMKENVEDWKELVESVKVDFNYDDAVFEPSVVDIPEKNEIVIGEYDIPENAGTIRVKITDLLSESLEISIDN